MDFAETNTLGKNVKIVVAGVGGAGGNAINNLIKDGLKNVTYLAINTDSQDLEKSLADMKLQIGVKTTGGAGAGSHPETGRAAAEENYEDIKKFLDGAKMVFVAAGMGGGTGTGAAPIVAKIAKEIGALTVGVVTTPIPVEGRKRQQQAELGIKEIFPNVDSLIIISNEKLFATYKKIAFKEFWKIADAVLGQGVRSITEIITETGMFNTDFNDVVSIMKDKGFAHIGIGKGEGDDKVSKAVRAAIENPILEVPINGAGSALVNIKTSEAVPADVFESAMEEVKNVLSDDGNIIMGLYVNEEAQDEIEITVIATDLKNGYRNIGANTDFTPWDKKDEETQQNNEEKEPNQENNTKEEFDPFDLNKTSQNIAQNTARHENPPITNTTRTREEFKDNNIDTDKPNPFDIPTFLNKDEK